VFVQEHWLLPSNINLFTNVNNAFAGFAVSGVCDIEQFSLTGGRPYGGIGVLWRQSAQFSCTIIAVNESHRCLAVNVKGNGFNLICFNVYLPSFVNNDSYEDGILDCFAFIDFRFLLCRLG
jgi:hypothetical protein